MDYSYGVWNLASCLDMQDVVDKFCCSHTTRIHLHDLVLLRTILAEDVVVVCCTVIALDCNCNFSAPLF